MILIYLLCLSLSCLCNPHMNPEINLNQYLQAPQHLQRIRVFDEVIDSTFSNSQCTSNLDLIHSYNTRLYSYNLSHILPSSNTLRKLLIDAMIDFKQYERVIDELSPDITHYSICQPGHHINTLKKPQPHLDRLKRQVSVKATFQYYPYLHLRVSSNNISQMLSILPLKLKKSLYIARFVIYDNKIYRQIYNEQDVWNDFVWKLHKLSHKLPEMDFIVYMWDTIHEQIIHQHLSEETLTFEQYDTLFQTYKKVIVEMPAFMWSKDINNTLEFNKLLMIDNHVNSQEWRRIFAETKDANRKVSWDCKVEKAYFRGSYMGGLGYNQDKTKFPRLQLVNISRKYPQYLNAKLSNHNTNLFESLIEEPSTSTVDEYSLIENQVNYKYLVSVDGWTAAWKRLPWILLSNSLVLKQETTRIQWFYAMLKPNIHYLPVKEDLSDLIDQIEFAKSQDGLMRRISNEATIFAQQAFKQSRIYHDFLNILQEYAAIQNIRELPPELDRMRVEGLDYVTDRSDKYQIEYLVKREVDIVQQMKDNTGNILQGGFCVCLVLMGVIWKMEKYAARHDIEFSPESVFLHFTQKCTGAETKSLKEIEEISTESSQQIVVHQQPNSSDHKESESEFHNLLG